MELVFDVGVFEVAKFYKGEHSLWSFVQLACGSYEGQLS